MLYTAVDTDWGETLYYPTTLGNVLLVVVLIALLALAILFTRMQMKKTAVAPTVSDGDHKMNRSKLTVKQLAFCAMAIALGTVLSNIKLFHFPTGGSITLLSMLVICLPGYWFGLGAGIATGVARCPAAAHRSLCIISPAVGGRLSSCFRRSWTVRSLLQCEARTDQGIYCRGSWKICVCRDLRMDLLRLLCLGRLGSPALLPRLQCYLYLL